MVNEKDAFTAVETDSVDSRRVNVLLQSPNSPSLSGTSSRAAVGGEEEGAAGVAPFEAGQVAPRSNNKCRARIIPARADPKQLALQSTIPRMMAIICLIVSKRQSPRPTHVMGIGYLRLCQVGRRKSGGWKRKGIEKKWKGGGYKRKGGCGWAGCGSKPACGPSAFTEPLGGAASILRPHASSHHHHTSRPPLRPVCARVASAGRRKRSQ